MVDDMRYLDILSDKKVLCVDDEVGVLNNLVEILENFFETVCAVQNGEEALREAKKGFYDVLIFDICMPKLDGLDAIEKIRDEDKKVPIIILSSHTEYDKLWKAVNLKITKYLTKPCNQDELYDALKEACLEITDYKDDIRLVDDCCYNYFAKEIESKSGVVKLSKSESRLLEYFIKNSKRVLSYDNILDYMWDFEKPSKEAVKSIVKDLRKKIDGDFIKNVYGIGYTCEI